MITNPQHSCNSYYTVGHYQAFKKTTPVATLSYIQATADTSANTDAGDQYTGLDRFGRVIDQVWRSVAGSGTIMDRYQYGYDRAGNRLFKNNLLDTALSELYSYDNLNQLISFDNSSFFDPACFKVVSLVKGHNHFLINIRSISKTASCPICHNLSNHVRSLYTRTISDLPIIANRLKILLIV